MMKFKKYVLVGLMAAMLFIAGCGDKKSADGGEVFTAASAKNTDRKSVV